MKITVAGRPATDDDDVGDQNENERNAMWLLATESRNKAEGNLVISWIFRAVQFCLLFLPSSTQFEDINRTLCAVNPSG